MWKLRADMTLPEIRDRLLVDGYGYGGPDLARAVRTAYREGRVVWTKERLTIVGRDAVDLRPDR
jgi:hypothetical protein